MEAKRILVRSGLDLGAETFRKSGINRIEIILYPLLNVIITPTEKHPQEYFFAFLFSDTRAVLITYSPN